MTNKNHDDLSSDALFWFIESVWGYFRSITGEGVRQTLLKAKELVPELELFEVPTGTKCWDWEIPKEWVFRSAQIKRISDGKIILDAKINNLHVFNYSQPVNLILTLDELQEHLISDPSIPDAIPYRTSYYGDNWGFCISENQRSTLKPGLYSVLIDSEFINGSMTFGQVYIPGKITNEILFTTYICHPMMANNELSGPAIAVGLANHLLKNQNYYSYRILFVPETIGTIHFLSRNIDFLKCNLIAGYVLTCLGDDLAWNFMPSRTGDTLSDKVAKRSLEQLNINYKLNSFSDRGSDERQYCSPRVNLPVSSVMRSKYGSYPEYHTSKDDLTFISKKGLHESFEYFKHLIQQFENNRIPIAELFGEPMLSKRNLRSSIGGTYLESDEHLISQVLAYSDGSNDTLEMAKIFNVSIQKIESLINLLSSHKLVKLV
jgi:aminopeptidase-like protein